jgi:hypothetical protein
MKTIFNTNISKLLLIIALSSFCNFSVSAVDYYDYQAESMTLDNFEIDTITGAFEGALVTSTSDCASISKSISSTTTYYDVQVTYSSTSSDCAFEIYNGDELIDAWMVDEHTGEYTDDSLNRVAHTTQNVNFTDKLKLVAYCNDSASVSVDKIRLYETSVDDNACNMEWNSSSIISSLYLGGAECISSGSSFYINEFSGSKINTISQTETTSYTQNATYTDTYGYAQVKLRVERYDYHVRIKMIGLECMPRGDRSLCPVLSIPCASAVGYKILDDKMTVSESGNDLTLYWSSMADRDLTPGGYIALYAEDQETEALNEIATLDSLETPFISTPPTDIFLSSNTISEGNDKYDVVGVLSAEDPEGDESYYTLTSGEDDDDNSSFIIILDSLMAKEVFDYEVDSLYSIRIKVTDSEQNTYSESFTIKILKDEFQTSITETFNDNYLNIYPNPTGTYLNIKTDEICNIQIVNIKGEQMYSNKHEGYLTTIDVESFAAGVYFVRLYSDTEQTIQSFIKK